MALVVKNLTANAGDVRGVGSIPGLGRSPGRSHGNPLQYSCLKNPIDRGTWQARVHRATKSWTQLKQLNWRRQWHPTPVLLPGKSHGQRSLVGCSPWGR